MTKQANELEKVRTLEFVGKLHEEEDLSAIASVSGHLILGADEGHTVQLLTSSDEKNFSVETGLVLNDDDETETDIEDICCQDTICYIIGSHSRKRKKAKSDKSQAENRDRLYKKPSPEPDRAAIYQVAVKEKSLDLQDTMSLQSILEADPLLSRFLEIPSKENGIDIEGIAFSQDKLYIGFRSPVLRENYVPILQVDSKGLKNPGIKFIRMKGRGIRAMTETEGGFLILGGPPGDGEMSYQLYFWDGKDMVIGNDVNVTHSLTLLGEVPTPEGAKAEGLTILASSQEAWDIAVVYDGIPGGSPAVFRVSKP